MGNWLPTGRAVDPATSQQAETQREAGGPTYIAQNGSCLIRTQLNDTHVEGNVMFNVNMCAPSHDRTEETNAIPAETEANIRRCQAKLKFYLKDATKNLSQGTKEDGWTPLDKIYTELYITEGGSGEVNSEHEVIELECRRSNEEIQIQLNDIFKPLSNEENPPQRVLTKGIAGIGKTVAVQKFIQDWAARESNQTIQFIFPFTFRDLNLIQDQHSLVTLIGDHFEEEVKDLKSSDYSKIQQSILFIFDGLDESKLPLDFKKNEICRSVTKTTTVDVLLTNLITGKLLHKASVWITSRPAAATKIPAEFFHRVTEVRGFNDEQKEEYFHRKVSDRDMAQKILDHLQSKPLKSLYIMCHIPVFCWISAMALQSLLTGTHTGELPKTVTEMYTHFLIIQMKLKHQKDYQEGETDKEVIMKLGKLAYEQLEKGNIIFYEKDLESCKIDLTQAAVYSGICTQIIRKEYGLHKEVVYSFIHLSVHEFLAALYVLETLLNSGENLLPRQKSLRVALERGELPIFLLHKNAVRMALVSNFGKWDMFLRFLLGLSQDKHQELLQEAFGFEGRLPPSNEKTIKFIHEKIKKLPNVDKSINLFHCLNELGDQTLVEQVQKYHSSGDVAKLLPEHWSALVFLLLVSNDDLDVFDLKKYYRSDEVLKRLLPVLKVSKTAVLSDCNLTDRCCSNISSVLSLKSSGLEDLDLSRNKLQDSGVMVLSEGLTSPNCKLQRLRLAGCQFTESGCAALASSLRSNPAHLRVLDLAQNDLQDGGFKNLPEFLAEPLCQLETLNLNSCRLTAACCQALTSALSSSSALKEIDLTDNDLMDQGVELLSDWLRTPQCRLAILRLACCWFTNSGCAVLASSLKSNPTHLRVLDLARNNIQDGGVENLSEFLAEPLCRLATLNLNSCRLTAACCQALTSALSSSSALKEIDLTDNDLTDQGVELLSDWLRKHQCRLEKLRLAGCEFTNSGCAALASSLRSNPAHLRVLDLSQNDFQNGGVDNLPEFLAEPLCQLETLNLNSCRLTAACCQALTSALSSSSALKEIDLTDNDLMDQGVELLSDWLRKPQCRLEKLRLAGCKFTNTGFAALASSLRSNPAHLRVLDLSQNAFLDVGVKNLSEFLAEPLCRLETLNLNCCRLTTGCWRSLTSGLSSSSALKELDLSHHRVSSHGMDVLSEWLCKPQGRLEILRLAGCEFTKGDCAVLALSLKSNPANLRVLDLSKNTLKKIDVEILSEFLAEPLCQLEALNLRSCMLKATRCQALASALSNSSALKELDLSNNILMDQGLKLLSDWLKKPTCRLEILRLTGCWFENSGCAALASSLKSNPAHLRVLDLTQSDRQKALEDLPQIIGDPLHQRMDPEWNCCTLMAVACQLLVYAPSIFSTSKEMAMGFSTPMDEGVEALSDWLRKPQCRLEILRLSQCTEISCRSLASALRSNPSHLRELVLSRSDPGGSGLQLLTDLQKNTCYKLQTLIVTEGFI